MTNVDEAKAYIVGGGIASLSAAVLLIRDGGFRGGDIYHGIGDPKVACEALRTLMG